MRNYSKTFDQCQREYDNRTPEEPDECPECGGFSKEECTCEENYFYDNESWDTCDLGYDGILGEG